jgi:hypothetical protein
MSQAELDGKFRAATRDLGRDASAALLGRLAGLEEQTSIADMLDLTAA